MSQIVQKGHTVSHRSNPLQIAAAVVLTLSAHGLHALSAKVVARGSVERTYMEATFRERREKYEALWRARYGVDLPRASYSAALAVMVCGLSVPALLLGVWLG